MMSLYAGCALQRELVAGMLLTTSQLPFMEEIPEMVVYWALKNCDFRRPTWPGCLTQIVVGPTFHDLNSTLLKGSSILTTTTLHANFFKIHYTSCPYID